MYYIIFSSQSTCTADTLIWFEYKVLLSISIFAVNLFPVRQAVTISQNKFIMTGGEFPQVQYLNCHYKTNVTTKIKIVIRIEQLER